LRLPVRGDEPYNLVPVDWVSRAIVELIDRPAWHGRTFHLVSRAAVSARFLCDLAWSELKLDGIVLAGPDGGGARNRMEELFIEGLHEYWPYADGHPEFDSANTAGALPDLPPPVMDRPLLQRLVRFAVADNWGRRKQRPAKADTRKPSRSRIAHYVEEVFPRQARESDLARSVGLDVLLGLDVEGPGGGQWSCRWTQGELTYIRPALEQNLNFLYRTDPATFDAILQGRLSPQEAFFEKRLSIGGDLETALKLAYLFARFLADHPLPPTDCTEATDATPDPF
jgi:hypothetical protein